MGFSKDANGWSVPTPTAGWQDGYRTGAPSGSVTMIIFVSNLTGKDPGDGGFNAAIQGSFAQPYRTIPMGFSRMGGNGSVRPGSPDWILLATGETWTHEMVGFGIFEFFGPGLNSTNRMVFSSYDKTANISAPNNPPIPNPTTGVVARPIAKVSSGPHSGINYVYANTAVIGIDFYADTRDTVANPANASNPPAGLGIKIQNGTSNVLIEDNIFRWFSNGLDAVGQVPGNGPVELRRNIIRNCWGDKYGIGSGCMNAGLLIEENLVDTCGWDPVGDPSGSSLNHNLYISANNGRTTDGDGITSLVNLTFRGNINLNDLYQSNNRCGGYVGNNLWQIGGRGGTNVGPNNPGVVNTIENEVYIGGFAGGPGHNEFGSNALELQAPFGPTSDGPGYYGLAITGIQHLNVRNCIAAQGPGNADALTIIGYNGAWANLVTVSNCISYKFSGTTVYIAIEPVIDGGGNRATLSPSQAATFGWPHPERTPETYMAEVIHDGSTWADFSRRCRLQSRRNWNPLLMAESVNDYIREGFGKAFIGSAYAGGGTIATGTVTVRDAAGTTASVPVTLNIND